VRSVTDNAVLALLLEVSGTPKPGNVDRAHEYPDLRFEQFLAGAVGAREGLALAAEGQPVGQSFRRAIAGMAQQRGGNTQFGAILLLTPLVRAAGGGQLTPASATEVVAGTTVNDAVEFYQAFEYVDVAADDPPEGMDDLDVRRGEAAIPALRERGLTFAELMEQSASVDGVAAELSGSFSRTFDVADWIAGASGPVTDRAATAYLRALAAENDTFVVTQHDRETAAEVRRRAEAAVAGEEDPSDLAAEFVQRGINPGTTADLIAGGLFVALERGLEV